MEQTESLKLHKLNNGKITTSLRSELTPETLKLFYTPGVADVSSYVALHPDKLGEYTWTNNLVAIVSDGSAVLGLGDIGPEGAMPVMEGKAMLFKHFGKVDAVPVVLNVHTADEIVAVVKAISPSFGGINLEDIAAPKCFEVENRLKKELNIPVMHDDQHGTAIVVLAGLINAYKLKDIKLSESTIVVSGVGAAGVAIMKLIKLYEPKVRIIAVDSTGIISAKRTDLNEMKVSLIKDHVIESNFNGDLRKALTGSNVFIGVSKGDLLKYDDVRTMSKNPIIFAMANPKPEIMPEVAINAGALIVATGRSDFPNQINNVLAFPGIFRGAFNNKVKMITDEHKLAAAQAIADIVTNPNTDYIIPSVFNPKVVEAVSRVIT